MIANNEKKDGQCAGSAAMCGNTLNRTRAGGAIEIP